MKSAYDTMDPAAEQTLRARFVAGPFARWIARIDVRLFRLVRENQHNPQIHRVIHVASRSGEHGGIWLVIGATGAALDPGRRGRWMRALSAVLAAYLFNTAIKSLVRRRRPRVEGLPALIDTPTSLSFPSAHASSSFAAARAYSRLLGTGATRSALYGGATAMSWSRVYLGVHYPSDIAAGALLGTILGGAAR